jgi:hypothetical protein
MVIVQASLIINDITEWHFAGQLGWKQDKKAGVPSQTYIITVYQSFLYQESHQRDNYLTPYTTAKVTHTIHPMPINYNLKKQ